MLLVIPTVLLERDMDEDNDDDDESCCGCTATTLSCCVPFAFFTDALLLTAALELDPFA